MNNNERNHIFQVINLFFKGFFGNIIAALIALKFLYSQFGLTISIIILILFIAVFIFFAIAKWYKTVFYLKDNSIYYKTGIFNFKKREIPFEKICTVDISQKLFDKLFGVARIKIDTGSNKNRNSELTLLLKEYRTLQIKAQILNTEIDSTDTKKQDKFKISSANLFKYALVSDALFSGIAIIFVIYNFLDDIFKNIFDIDIFQNSNWIKDNIFLSVISIVLFILILSIILSIFNSFIKYYGFRINLDDNKLYINYGLLNKKSYSFEIKKIKGIHIKQNLLMQIFNIRALELESLGYGDEQGETAILFPICNLKVQNEIIHTLLPEFKFSGTIKKSPKKALPRFIFKKVMLLLILVGIITYFVPYGFISAILILFGVGLGYLEYKNSRIGYNDSLLYMSYRGFFKKQSFIKIKDVQSFEISNNYFQRRKKLCNYTLHIYSNQFGKIIRVKNLDKTNIFDTITTKI